MKGEAIVLAAIIGTLVPVYAFAQDSGNLKFEKRSSLNPNDYLLKSREDRRDSVFEKYQAVDLGVDLGIGSDCGRVDFKNTLRSSLTNMLDAKYFGDLGRNIIASSPMLATCYFSPTWCAILKHSQLSANFMSQMRLDQCALIDKYTDKRTEDFYEERQSCIHKKIEENGGDLESAMDSCRNVWQADLANWSGGDGKTPTNKLIESSAAWAGYQGEESKRAVDMVKSLVGDTVVTKGKVSVEYGSRRSALTPQRHLQELRTSVESKLCGDLVKRVMQERRTRRHESLISDSDLKRLSGSSSDNLIDRQTIEALAYMPGIQRENACKRLADALAMTTLTKDLNRSMDILAVSSQNPHLPPHRKAEIEGKRQALKESMDMTLKLEKERTEPLNRIVSQVNEEGEKYRDDRSERILSGDRSRIDNDSVKSRFFDCADGVMCERR